MTTRTRAAYIGDLDRFASTKTAARSGGPGQLVSTLRRGVSDAVLVVLGDSTGNETYEWVYRLAAWLGTEYPAYTVSYRLWNDGGQAYDTAVTIQAGTGSKTLTVYNGSVSGSGFDYSFAGGNHVRFSAMIPVEPTTVVISYGYNSLQSYYRQQQQELSEWVLGYWPRAEYVLTSQPPMATTATDAGNHLARQADTRNIAADRGWGLIDVTQSFIDYGNYNSIINADKIHPLATGQDLWLAEAQAYFTRYGSAPLRGSGTRGANRLFVDPTRFVAYSGTPVLSFVSGILLPKWDMDPASTERIVAVTDIPPEWGKVHVDLLWSTPGGSTNGVVWQLDYLNWSGTKTITSGQGMDTSTNGSPVTVASASTANVFRILRMMTAMDFTGGRPIAFRVNRIATDAADTYASDAYVLGLIIRRAE